MCDIRDVNPPRFQDASCIRLELDAGAAFIGVDFLGLAFINGDGVVSAGED